MMHLSLIPSTHIDKAWADGAHLLSEACETSSGDITADQLKMLLLRGERTLFAGVKDEKPIAWGVVQIDILPNKRVCNVCLVWARNGLYQEFVEQVEEFAKSNGCSELRCSAKQAQSRLYQIKFGFEPIYEVLRKELK